MDLKEWELDHYRSMTSNMLSVLQQLSIHGFALFQDQPLTQSSVRKALKALAERRLKAGRPDNLAHVLGQEGASNLFYYLFEDYAAAAPFQAARDTLSELVSASTSPPTRHCTFLSLTAHSLDTDRVAKRREYNHFRYHVIPGGRTS